MIRIGSASFKTAKPKNLDDQLIAATGFGAAEAEKLLVGGPHLAAAALAPFLGEDGPDRAALAKAIVAGELSTDDIRALYGVDPVEVSE